MSQICIITDSSVHFPNPVYPGNNLVTVLPIQIQMGGYLYPDSKDPNDQQEWYKSFETHTPKVIVPGVEEFSRLFLQCGQKHQSVLVILHSSQLSPAVDNARKAAQIVKNSSSISIIDSQTTGAGLGLLVQEAVQTALQNNGRRPDVDAISLKLRGLVSHVYTVFFLPNLRALANSGFLDPSQAIVGEMLGIIPFYVMEASRLVSIQKARNMRQLVDMMFEFTNEFMDISHVALLQGYPPYEQEIRSLRERISVAYPEVNLSEHHMSLSLLSLLGSHSLGLVVMEKTENK
jgi:DegV family protein with EDD domain